MHPQNQLKKEFLQSSAVKPSGTVSANYNNSNYNTMHLVTQKKNYCKKYRFKHGKEMKTENVTNIKWFNHNTYLKTILLIHFWPMFQFYTSWQTCIKISLQFHPNYQSTFIFQPERYKWNINVVQWSNLLIAPGSYSYKCCFNFWSCRLTYISWWT